ncbi:MAG: hypothetical protein SPE63_03470, partial [Prevotella sp.]|nr:hypothetical protein [Prevotella sp.]
IIKRNMHILIEMSAYPTIKHLLTKPQTDRAPSANYPVASSRLYPEPASGFVWSKKAALFSNFNHRHFVRTEILYNFVGPKQWVGANCIALTDQRRRQEEKG